MDKLRPRLTPECHGTVLEGFVALAEAHGPREIRALRPALIAKYGHLGEFQRREDRLKHGRSLSQPYDDDGMAEYRLRLDPEGSAVLEAILGPLAAPQPSTEHGSDTRTSDQRRADALVEVCRRAAAAGGAAPATAKAAVVVTMDYQDLKDRTGAGTTLTGELLAPETVRQDGLRRRDHPGRPRPKVRGARPGPDRAAGHPEAVPGAVDPRPRLHLPRLLEAPGVVRRTPLLALVRRRPHRPVEHGPAVPEAPHDRAPEGLHRHRRHVRGHLAPVAAPPRDPPPPGGSHRHARRHAARPQTCPGTVVTRRAG